MGKEVPVISSEQASSKFWDGMSVMVGGFMTNGTPKGLIDALIQSEVKNLTVICNDAGLPNEGVGRLLRNHQVKKLIASHVGLNPECGQQFTAGELELVLSPQGTLAECIRAGGAGLGGILTPTGVGTVVAEGKQTVEVEGKEYLLELPVKADVALIGCYVADKSGNLRYKGSTRNFNEIMATAAEMVLAEPEELVESGEIGPDYVETPGIFVDYIVRG